MQKKLYRSRSDRMLFGVCGGVADYLGIDSTIVRLLWAASAFFALFGLWAYIVAALLIPEEPARTRKPAKKTAKKKANKRKK